MSQNQLWNGVVYPIPTQGDLRWAPPLDRYLVALGTYALAPSGGAFTLTADVNFGNNFGLIAKYLTSESAGTATAGMLRLSHNDLIAWRNAAGNGNLYLTTDGSDNLVFNGGIIPTGLSTLADGKIWIGSAGNLPVAQTLTGDVTTTNAGVTAIGAGKIVNSQVNASAAIAYSKLNLSGSILNSDIFSSAAIAYSKLASLTSGHILVGSAGAVATDVALSGDASLANTGALTLATVNSNVGSFTNANLTVNAKGLVTAASSGSAGGVTSVHADANPNITGAVQLVSGTNVTLSQVGQAITITSSGGSTAYREDYIVGTPLNNYTGSTTVFNLVNSYNVAGHSLIVTLDGDVQTIGATIDYVETNSTTVTFNNALVSGEKVSFIFQTATSSAGIVNSGTSTHLAYYASSSNAVSDASGATISGNYTFSGTQTLSSISFSSTSGIIGTTTNNSAAAGSVGEYVQSVVAAVPYTSGTVTNITSISLTAGDWDVTGMIVGQGGSSSTLGPNFTNISLFSGATTTDLVIGDNTQYWTAAAASTSSGGNVPLWRLSISGTTTVYLKINSTFVGGSPTAWGKLAARRVR